LIQSIAQSDAVEAIYL